MILYRRLLFSGAGEEGLTRSEKIQKVTYNITVPGKRAKEAFIKAHRDGDTKSWAKYKGMAGAVLGTAVGAKFGGTKGAAIGAALGGGIGYLDGRSAGSSRSFGPRAGRFSPEESRRRVDMMELASGKISEKEYLSRRRKSFSTLKEVEE